MKKIVLLAAFAVVGFSVVSCSSDDSESVNVRDNTKKTVFNGNALFSREGDTISTIDTINTVITQTAGPGDDPIIVPPPPTKP